MLLSEGEIQSDGEQETIDNEKQERVKALLVRIGEKSASPLHKNLEMLSKALSRDLDNQTDFILDILFQCVVHLTTKTGVYSTLVGLLNIESPQFGKRIVNQLAQDFTISVASKDFARINILIRFTAELVNSSVISTRDFLAFLKKLYEDFVKNANSQVIANYFFYCIIGVLPYGGEILISIELNELKQLLKDLNDFYVNSNKGKAANFYVAFKRPNETVMPFLGVFWEGLRQASSKKWQTDAVLSPHKHFEHLFAKSRPHQFNVGAISMPEIESSEAPELCNLLRIFPKGDSKDSPKVQDDVSRCVLFDHYSAIAVYFEDSLEECVKQLVFITEQNQSHFLLVESIFSLMLQLPCTQSNTTYHGRLFIELFKVGSKVYPKILARAVDILFDEIENIDIECRDRLANWFAFHLGNFRYTWAWQNWAFVSNLPVINPKRVFCSSVLLSCVELSQSSASSFTDEIKSLLPASLSPDFAYPAALKLFEKNKKSGDLKADDVAEEEKDDMPVSRKNAFIAELLKRIDEKEPHDLVLKLLEPSEGSVSSELGEEETVRVLFSCLLYAGMESFSNLFRLFDKYKPTIMKIQPSESAQRAAVDTAIKIWKNSHLHKRIILPKLITYGFIRSKALIEVLLSEEHLSNFYMPFYSTILTNLIDLFSQRIIALKNILEKEFPDPDDQEKSESRKNLLNKIVKTNSDRQQMLRAIVERLTLAANHFIQRIPNYEENGLFKVIFDRLVMFLRKYKDPMKEVKESLKKSLYDDETLETTQVFSAINEF